jgi:hypothetical protein
MPDDTLPTLGAYEIPERALVVRLTSSAPPLFSRLGVQTVTFTNGSLDTALSVLLAGHNSTGFGKVTWLRYTAV